MENLNSKHDELRNDFNSFTVDISKWQIDTDRRIADAENDISGESHHEIDLMSLTPYQTFISSLIHLQTVINYFANKQAHFD